MFSKGNSVLIGTSYTIKLELYKLSLKDRILLHPLHKQPVGGGGCASYTAWQTARLGAGCKDTVHYHHCSLAMWRCFCYSKPFFWLARREPYVKDAYVGLCILQSVEKNINLDGPFTPHFNGKKLSTNSPWDFEYVFETMDDY